MKGSLLADLPAPDDRSFSGVSRLYGEAGAQIIRQSHVVVVGIGGVGSWAAEALARTGVGKITLIDFDHISASNINRQIHALQDNLGQSKVEAMRHRIAAIHPAITVETIDDFVSPNNWLALLPTDAHAVIDCCDQLSAKVTMAAWARTQPRPFITVGAAGGKRMPLGMQITDLSRVSHDPLLAKLRYQLRKHHGAPAGNRTTQARKSPQKIDINCLYSTEPVQAAVPTVGVESVARNGLGAALNCQGYGSQVAVTASFGMAASAWVLNCLSYTGLTPKSG